MRTLILVVLLTAGCAAAADLVCESKNTTSATYNWNDPAGWNCYSTPGKTLVANEYPGKNYPTNNYIVVLGLTTNSSIVTEHAMNVDATLGLLGKSYALWSLNTLANNGSGAIRVTTNTANTVANGDKVYCYGQGGTNPNNAYGIWTAANVGVGGANTFDLQGSTYASTITGGYCEIPAALKRTGYASAATTVGKWKINAGVTAKWRGDVIDAWGYTTRLDETYAMIRCGDSTNGGCTWQFDSSGPVAYLAKGSVGTGTRNFRAFIRGSAAARSVITSAGGANNGRFDRGSCVQCGDLYADYAAFSNLGSASVGMWSIHTESSSMFSINHSTFTNVGHVLFVNTLLDPTVGTFLVTNSAFDTPLSSSYGSLYAFGPPAGKTITVGPAVSFKGTRATASVTNAAGPIVFDRCMFDGPPAFLANTVGGRAGATVQDSLFVKGTDRAGDTMYPENLLRNYFWVDHDAAGNNPHHYGVFGLDGYYTHQLWDGNIFDQNGDYTDGSGDALNEAGNAFASLTTATLTNNLFLPAGNYNGQAATNWTASTSLSTTCAVNVQWSVHHNTIFSTTDSGGEVIRFGHLCAEQTGKIAGFYCNAAIQSTAKSGGVLGTESLVTTTATDVAVSTNVKYNGLYNWDLQHNAGYGAADGGYYAYKAATPPGTGDQAFSRMPDVVDWHRRLKTWANQKYSQTFATDLDVIAYMRANVSTLYDIPDLVSWVKGGWALKEPALKAACFDGSDVGALVATLTIDTTSLPDATINTPYSQTVSYTGSATPTWDLSAGSLPAGLTLNASTGVIGGTPTAYGTYSFTVRATSADGMAAQTLILVVPGFAAGEVTLRRSQTYQFQAGCPSGHNCEWRRLSQAVNSGSTLSAGGLYTAPATMARGASLGGCPLQPHNSVFRVPVSTLTPIATSSNIVSRLYSSITYKTPFAYTTPFPNLVKSSTPTTHLMTDVQGDPPATYLSNTTHAWDGEYQFRTPPFFASGVGTRDYPEMGLQQGARAFNADNRYLGINRDTCEVTEIYFAGPTIETNVLAQPNSDPYLVPVKYDSMEFKNGWGLKHNRSGPNAGGIWHAPMQVDWAELARVADRDGATGNLGHRIAVTVDNDMFPQNPAMTDFRWPAIRAAAGCQSCSNDLTILAPYGSLLRLKQSAIDAFNFHTAATAYSYLGNVTRIENMLHVLLNTMRDYGFIVMDGEKRAMGIHGRGFDGTPDTDIVRQIISKSNTWGDLVNGLEAVMETRMVPGLDGSNVIRDQAANPEGAEYYDTTTSTSLGIVDIAINPGTVGTLSPIAHIVAGAGPVDLGEDTWATGFSDNSALVWTATPSIGTLNASTGSYTAPATIAAPTSVTVTACHQTDSTACASKRVIVYPPIGSGLYLRALPNKAGANYTDPQGRTWWGADTDGVQTMFFGSGRTSGGGAVTPPAGSDYPSTVYTSAGYFGEKVEKLYLPNGKYKTTALLTTWGANQTANLGIKEYTSIDINGVEAFPPFYLWDEVGGALKGANKTATTTITNGKMVYAVREAGDARAYYFPWVTGLVIEPVATTRNVQLVRVRMRGRTKLMR